LSKDGDIIREEQTVQLMTSWDNVYRQLKNAFPDNLYHNRKKLTRQKQDKDYVVAEFKDGQHEKFDLLVGADGSSSTVRQQLLPEVTSKYAGYVAWRGVLDENKVSSDVVKFFANKFTFFHGTNTHILCYLIPGSNGELSEDKRRLNWVWYVNVPLGDKLQSLLTDRHGIHREFSVPQGAVKNVQQQKDLAQSSLPSVFSDLIVSTNDPFVRTIFDLSVPRMTFGRVCLVGDAAFVPRPHTASGASKAVTIAIALANSIATYNGNVVEALKKWEPSQLEVGNHLKQLGIVLGNRAQFNR